MQIAFNSLEYMSKIRSAVSYGNLIFIFWGTTILFSFSDNNIKYFPLQWTISNLFRHPHLFVCLFILCCVCVHACEHQRSMPDIFTSCPSPYYWDAIAQNSPLELNISAFWLLHWDVHWALGGGGWYRWPNDGWALSNYNTFCKDFLCLRRIFDQ